DVNGRRIRYRPSQFSGVSVEEVHGAVPVVPFADRHPWTDGRDPGAGSYAGQGGAPEDAPIAPGKSVDVEASEHDDVTVVGECQPLPEVLVHDGGGGHEMSKKGATRGVEHIDGAPLICGRTLFVVSDGDPGTGSGDGVAEPPSTLRLRRVESLLHG